jgi:solute carrier family 25 protein 33/36
LRQEGDKYKGFMQTLKLVIKEEGFKNLYKGLGTHLIRQIPNNLIVMTTYELITDYLRKKKND